MNHVWIKEEVDGGPVGIEDFWKCQNCRASGGPCWSTPQGGEIPPPTLHPFLADGSGFQLCEDCELSQRLIALHKINQLAMKYVAAEDAWQRNTRYDARVWAARNAARQALRQAVYDTLGPEAAKDEDP